MLLATADSQVCCEEQAEQTRSTDNTVKDLIWLLSYAPPDLEFQLGRVLAVCRRIHRMLMFGLSIDDYNEDLGDDDDQGFWKLRTRGRRWRR